MSCIESNGNLDDTKRGNPGEAGAHIALDADTLNGSKHANMKELRCDTHDGVWRVAFAFDTERKALLLTAGDKSGVSQKLFYKKLIKTADARFDAHLERLKGKDR